MSANCPYIYDTNGIRHPSGQVFVRQVDADGSQRTMAVRSDVQHGDRTPYKTSEGVAVDGSIGLEEIDEAQTGFIVVAGAEIAVGLERGRTQGRRGRNSFDDSVFPRLRAELGQDGVRALAERGLSTLPGLLGDEEVGESRLWARDLLVAASKEVERGLLGVLREHPSAVQLLAVTPTRMDPRQAAKRVETGFVAHRNVERFASQVAPGVEATELSRSSDPLLRSAYRTLVGDELELLRGVLSTEPVEARSALLNLSNRAPTALLEAVLDSDHTTLVKVAAFYALLNVAPERAGARALGVLSSAKAEQPMSSDTARLCEVAVGALPEPMRERLALDAAAPWLWQKVAVSSLVGLEANTVINAVCESRSSHPLARIAAVGRCNDEAVLARVAGGSDKRLGAVATERLMVVQGVERPAQVARRLDTNLPGAQQVRLVAIDIDGTFAADDDSVPQRNTNGVRRFADAGGVVAFTTTRSAEYALPVAREALNGRDGYLVCDDGASIIDVASGVFLRGATPLGAGIPDGTQRTGHTWELTNAGGVPIEEAASIARGLSGPRGVVVLEKTGRDGWGLRYGTDKATTLEDVAGFAGVELHQCCVFGDGKVDVPMFEAVRSAGGVVVAVANAQPGVDDHAAVSIRTLSNGDGGVGYILDALSDSTWPALEDQEPNKPVIKEEVYAQYAIIDGGELEASLEQAGIGHLVAHRRGSTFHGGSAARPGHVTFAHPNDFKGQPLPLLKDSTVTVVGYVDTELATALVCSVDDGSGSTTVRPDGKTFHVTLRTQNGVPPVQSNVEVAKGWTRLEKPLLLNTRAVQGRRQKR
jgi:hypothetical protein